MNDNYIIVMRDDQFWLVGPFETQRAAGEWGSKDEHNPADDPRWQTIRLADPFLPVRIVPPHLTAMSDPPA